MSFSLSLMLLLAVPEASKTPAAAIDLSAGASPAEPGVFIDPLPTLIAQVRIERRIIIRVPRRRPMAVNRLANIRRLSQPQAYTEKKIGKCLPMSDILGVQMADGRELDLLTRNRIRIRARLEKKCQARSFYSGFYMEKSGDGKICAGRDILHSRTGAKCEIDRFRQLVPE